MQDRPTAPELLDAMAAKLFAEVREWVPRERRFQILVLANLCAVIARELRAGDAPDEADLALFRELGGEGADSRGGASASDLARQIRAGRARRPPRRRDRPRCASTSRRKLDRGRARATPTRPGDRAHSSVSCSPARPASVLS